jgi:hypothetical protein
MAAGSSIAGLLNGVSFLGTAAQPIKTKIAIIKNTYLISPPFVLKRSLKNP